MNDTLLIALMIIMIIISLCDLILTIVANVKQKVSEEKIRLEHQILQNKEKFKYLIISSAMTGDQIIFDEIIHLYNYLDIDDIDDMLSIISLFIRDNNLKDKCHPSVEIYNKLQTLKGKCRTVGGELLL